jgi:hypothetical protein
MKAIDSSLVNKDVKTTSGNPEAACPTCGCAAWLFENGVVFCSEHGHFEPEPADVRLFGMLQSFNASRGLVFPVTDAGGVPADADFASRHRPVPSIPELVIAAGDRVDGDIQGAYESGSRRLS